MVASRAPAPGRGLCALHARPLLASARRTSSARDRLVFHDLESSILPDDRPCVAPDALRGRERAALAVARASAELLMERDADGPGPEVLWLRRYSALRNAGYVRGSRGLDPNRLRIALTERFGAALLEASGCAPGGVGADD